ncbi:MAG TPA: GNAT family N-acetyltransferase [Novosphingobium sp.]|nr:GNAT family N-acetyltransferase [Novosphingobium sp.]
MTDLTHRLATTGDLESLRALMQRSIAQLQHGFLSEAQVRVSHAVMGLDTQLMRDGTYFLVLHDEQLAGCGGWSFRRTLYGGDDSAVSREDAHLDPRCDAAKIRAMYTDPGFARRGVGRYLLALCEAEAYANGFRRAEMMATLAGEPLYRSCGYAAVEQIQSSPIDGVTVPLVRMAKVLDHAPAGDESAKFAR